MQNLKNRFKEIAILILALFAIHAANVATGMRLTQFGIVPRTLIGLRGILFSPLLHGSWDHLLANAGPLAAMLGLLAFNKRYALWRTTAAIWIVTGCAVWLAGRPGSVQIGASSLIYGLATFLITAAWINQDALSALIAFCVVIAYGGLVWGLLPAAPGISWEGHLCGALSGIAVAKLMRKPKRRGV